MAEHSTSLARSRTLVNMNAKTIDEAWGRACAIELLERMAAWADERAADGSFHTMLIKEFGQLATVGNVPRSGRVPFIS